MKFGSLLLATASVFLVYGQTNSKLAPELAQLDADQSVDVIVKYAAKPTAFHRALATHRGGKLVRSLDIINSDHLRIPAGRLAGLANDPAVEYIHPDRPVQATGQSVQPDYAWVSLTFAVRCYSTG